MSGIGEQDAFLAALKEDDVAARPPKRKAGSQGGSVSKRPAPEEAPAPRLTPKVKLPAKRLSLGAPGRPSPRGAIEKVVERRRDVVDTRPSGLRPPRPAGALPRSAMVEVATCSMDDAVAGALGSPVPDVILNAARDARDCLAKAAASVSFMTSALAEGAGLTSDDLEKVLSRPQVACGEPMISVRAHDAEKGEMQRSYETLVGTLRADITRLRAEVDSKDNVLAEQSQLADVAQKKAESLTRKLEKVRQQLEASREEIAEARTGAKSAEEKYVSYKAWMSEEVPKLKRACYRNCMSKLLKKIVHKFPSADMAYFADMSDIPDVDIDSCLLAAYAETEEVATDDHVETGDAVEGQEDGEGDDTHAENVGRAEEAIHADTV